MIGKVSIKKFENAGDQYDFVCWYWETSNAWGHEVRLVKNTIELAKAKIRYYNRTWEAYTFQSAIGEAIYNYKKDELQRYIDDYKFKNKLKGYDLEKHEEFEKPLPRGMKKQLTEEFEKQDRWQKLADFVERGK